MTKWIGISGLLRRGSFNTALPRAVATLLAADTSLQISTLHGIRVSKLVAGVVDAVRRSQR